MFIIKESWSNVCVAAINVKVNIIRGVCFLIHAGLDPHMMS